MAMRWVPFQPTPVVSLQAWIAAANALFAPPCRFRVDYGDVPFVTYTAQEVARVALTEAEALRRPVSWEVSRYDLAEFDGGVVKVLTQKGWDRMVVATVVGAHAEGLIGDGCRCQAERLRS